MFQHMFLVRSIDYDIVITDTSFFCKNGKQSDSILITFSVFIPEDY